MHLSVPKRSHPELVDLQERRDLLTAASKKLSQALRSKLAEEVRCFGNHFDEDFAFDRSDLIEKNTVELSSPLSIIDVVKKATLDIEDLLKMTAEQGSKYVSEESASDVIIRHSTLLGRLVCIRPGSDRDNKKSTPWDAKEATKRLRYILDSFNGVLKLIIFSPKNAQDLYSERAAVDEEYKAVTSRLENELPSLARLHMSTIGSSHRIPAMNENNCDGDLVHTFGQLALNDIEEDFESGRPIETICIFDESGCIPAYELLGLSRLGRPIKALILVGDKHQLPPYDPAQGRSVKRGDSFRSTIRSKQSKMYEKMQSLLDVSALTVDSGKIMLTLQYRVPRDIAEMLNSRVYRGSYMTPLDAKVPLSGMSKKTLMWCILQY